MRALRLDRVALNVGNLADAIGFYEAALGFRAGPIVEAGAATTAMLGARSVRASRLQRGAQILELTQCEPPGAPYPPDSNGNDLWFQHCALVTSDMRAAYARLCRHAFTPISQSGPQTLPGGIAAFKFRDPDGHPLELIAFPSPDPRTADGIDHSAISVADPARSIAFYAALGLAERSRQVNTGAAQDALDGLAGVSVDVIALAPESPAPHLELLGYRMPHGRPATPSGPSDITSSRLVFGVAEPASAGTLLRDPDGHGVVLEG